MPSVRNVTVVSIRAAIVAALTGCAATGAGETVGDGGAVDAPGPLADGAEAPVDAGSVDAPRPDAAPACGASTWSSGTHLTVTLAHGGRDRSYVVHVGDAADDDAALPLVLNFHGLNNSPSTQQSFSRMNDLADDEGFIVVYPQGVGSSFNAGGCCGTAAEQDIDDVGFARAIVDDVASKICVDRRRVYATGFSNGGFMSHRLGCEASDLVAAIAPVAGARAVATCAPPRPVPVIGFHGDADSIVSYASGAAAVEAWVAHDDCAGSPARTMHGASYCDRWASCAGGAAVELCTITGGWHLWPGASSAHPATPAIWEFLRAFTLPE